MSITDWVRMPEDEPGELLDGQLVEEEVPDLVHETVVSWLIGLLRAWIIARGGFVFGSEGKFVVGSQRGRKPDVSVFFPGTAALPRRGAVRVPPDIVVEVISPTPRDRRRDRIEKPDDYAAFGVRYYWLIDPEERSLEILALGPDGRYARALDAGLGWDRRGPGVRRARDQPRRAVGRDRSPRPRRARRRGGVDVSKRRESRRAASEGEGIPGSGGSPQRQSAVRPNVPFACRALACRRLGEVRPRRHPRWHRSA